MYRLMDLFFEFVFPTVLAVMFAIGVVLFFIALVSPQRDPCERGFVYMKGACVQGYWPEGTR